MSLPTKCMQKYGWWHEKSDWVYWMLKLLNYFGNWTKRSRPGCVWTHDGYKICSNFTKTTLWPNQEYFHLNVIWTCQCRRQKKDFLRFVQQCNEGSVTFLERTAVSAYFVHVSLTNFTLTRGRRNFQKTNSCYISTWESWSQNGYPKNIQYCSLENIGTSAREGRILRKAFKVI